MDLKNTAYLIIDWGTTNFRAFAMTRSDELLATKEAPLGLLQVTDGKFDIALEGLLTEWGIEFKSLPIYMAGMVGSAKGWVNVPYAKAPASAQQLVEHSHKMTLPWGASAFIIPGVSYNITADQHDVMRGEEVQLVGLAKLIGSNTFSAVLPGTHSKHASVENNQITSFSSFLTGEVFSVFIEHTLLGKGLSESAPYDETAFLKGVQEAQSGELTNKMFLAWTHRLFSNLTEQQIPDYLSGLMIGFELRNVSASHLNLVGGSKLCQRYQIAAQALNITSEIYAGNDCFLAGMKTLISELTNVS